MTNYCQDRDLLGIEPIVFLGGGFPGQEIIAGQNGQISGTAFTIGSGSFTNAGAESGMVLCTYSTTPPEGSAYEIVSVGSAMSLTISILRPDTDTPAVPPQAQSGLHFHIRTYAAQIRTVSAALSEKLQQVAETPGVDADGMANSTQLRLAAAYGALADIFVARADNAELSDANWIKARHYRQLSRDLLLQFRLPADANGDGHAEQTVSLSNVRLRRI